LSEQTAPSHGGDLKRLATNYGVLRDRILDFSSSINPLGPPEYLRGWISREIDTLDEYPQPRAESLRAKIASYLGRGVQEVVTGNGANEIIYSICRAVPATRVVTIEPSYLEYRKAASAAGLPALCIIRSESIRLEPLLKPGDLVFLGHPNNPTGELLDPELVKRILLRGDVFVAIDESFIDFA